MGGIFNAQILVDKLAKLNSSQQSIETLSHWCIFHRTKAKQVVETWDRQFHRSPRDQRVSFLYLANDILQNSRKKGSEFVVEFWRVLPDALNDVMQRGDEFGRNAATRLVDIWEERKVFGSRGQVLKEELLGRKQGNHNTLGKSTNVSKQSIGDSLERLISSFEQVYGGSLDEDSLLNKCQNVVNYIEKMEKEISNGLISGATGGSEVIQDLQRQHSILRQCIEQLKAAESSRVVLISHLRDALYDQESKLEQVRDKLQVAQARSETASNIFKQLSNIASGQLSSEQRQDSASVAVALQDPTESKPIAEEKEQSVPVTYNNNVAPENPARASDDNLKTTAAAMAAKLAASTSSAEMLSSLLSSLASEGIIGQQTQQISEDLSSDNSKRIKLDNGMAYLPAQHKQVQPLPLPHPGSRLTSTAPLPATTMLHHATTMQQLHTSQSFPPLQPPLHPPNQLTQTAGSTTSVPYVYGPVPPVCLPPPSSFSPGDMQSSVAPNSYQNAQASEGGGGFLSRAPKLPTSVPSLTHQ